MKQKLTPQEKVKLGMFMSLRELAQVVGLTKEKMCKIAKRPGFPFFEGKVRHPDFMKWYPTALDTPQGHRPVPGDEGHVPLRSDGQRQKQRYAQERLRALARRR